jgi:hypothetical protein
MNIKKRGLSITKNGVKNMPLSVCVTPNNMRTPIKPSGLYMQKNGTFYARRNSTKKIENITTPIARK